MAKKPKKTIAAPTVASQQEEHIWTFARQLGDPVNYHKGWAETAHSLHVPERLLVFAKDSRLPFLALSVRPHYQRVFVLLIVLKGAGQICVDERIFKLDEGQAFLIFPFQFRHYISLQESSLRWIFIHFEMSRAESLEFRRNHPWQIASESMQVLRHLLEAVSSRNSRRMTRGAEAQLLLAQFLYHSPVLEMRPPSSSPTIFAKTQKWLKPINSFINRHINQPFKIEDMARGLGCSKSYLRDQFKEHFKISLGRHVAQVRLHKAAGLLRENVLNISAVAQACGYGSVYAFSRKFHKAMGRSPRDYRNHIHKGNAGG